MSKQFIEEDTGAHRVQFRESLLARELGRMKERAEKAETEVERLKKENEWRRETIRRMSPFIASLEKLRKERCKIVDGVMPWDRE